MKLLVLSAVWLASAFAGGAALPPDPGVERARSPDRKFTLSGLLRSLEDRDENVRAKAAEDLGKIDPPAVEAVGDLIKALEDGSSIVRNRAAESLERIGTPKARKAVLKYRKKLGRKKGW